MNPTKAETLELFREAVAQDLNTLATLHHAELNDALLGDLAAANFPDGIGLRLLGDDGMRAIVLMRQAMMELRAPLAQPVLAAVVPRLAEEVRGHEHRAAPIREPCRKP